MDDLQVNHRRLYGGVNPRSHLWKDILVEHKRIVLGGSAAASTAASASQEHPIAAPAAGGEGNKDELRELLDLEAEGLQVSWNQHGDRSIAKQLAANDCPPPLAAEEGGTHQGISSQAVSGDTTRQHASTTTVATIVNAMQTRLNRVLEECAAPKRQANALRKRRR